VQKVLDYVKQLGVATKEDTDAFGELEKRMAQMGLKAESLGRKVLGGENGFTRQIIEAADFMNMSPGEANAKFWSKESWSWVRPAATSRAATRKQKPFRRRGAFTRRRRRKPIRAAAARAASIRTSRCGREVGGSIVSSVPSRARRPMERFSSTHPGGRKGHWRSIPGRYGA
jgi:hypothetical protein